MNEAERRLRDAFTEGAAYAPTGDGMLAAVHHRVRRRRTARLAVAAGVAVIALVGGLVFAAARGRQEMATSTAGAAQMPAFPGVVGEWEPVSLVGFTGSIDTPRREPPLVRFTDDGHWEASDGCNGSAGRYHADNGVFSATTDGPSTLIGCANVPNTSVLTKATSYALRGDELVFTMDGPIVLGTYRRVG
ncbi:META domain-containing protein [Actinokineospora terrae]|uniref:DUF306 domain-containing protein n=1 Tax=Actinokineospora terrae TaxID=155974 RepID=A0A1H9NLG4_9PSEU|nr:META domain-containing protein [Actinokineospora terrae]SER36778.1 hypothetical protein SAMN04487818_10321 [Actinokineospora terrae]